MNNRTENEDWLKTLQRKLNDFEEPVEGTAWQQIEQKLSTVRHKRTLNHRKYYYATAAAIAAFIGISVFFRLIYSPVAEKMSSDVAITQTNAAQTNAATKANTTSAIAQTVIRQDKSLGNANATSSHSNLIVMDRQQIVVPNEEKDYTISTTNINQSNNTNQVQSEGQKTEDKKKTATSTRTVAKGGGKKRSLPVMVKGGYAKGKDSRWSVGVSVGGSGAIQTNSNDYGASVSQDVAGSNYQYDILSPTACLRAVPSGYSNYSFKHHIPISFGLNIRKLLNKNFSVETGIVFTMLNSDIENNSKKQHIYYIGIPIKGNWTFYKGQGFELYLTAGAMGEKSIYARVGSEKLKLNEIQFSVNGGAGIAVGLSKSLQLYGEAGVAYFFDDGSFVQTVRKDKPFNLNIQAGLRFSY